MCTGCNSTMSRVWQATPAHFKGGGWAGKQQYQTMSKRRRGLGRGLTEINAANTSSTPRLRSNDPFGIKSLIPNEEQLAAREADPTGYEMAMASLRSRVDGLETLTPDEAALQRRLSRFGTDPDFGPGYEVVNPAKTSGHGDARAQKIGYNRSLQYLAILMRDGKMVGYPGVDPDTWAAYQNYSSTHSYIYDELAAWSGAWDDLGKHGTPPQTNEQLFEQGTQD